MNLPKRNSEDGRYYLMTPDAQERLQPLPLTAKSPAPIPSIRR